MKGKNESPESDHSDRKTENGSQENNRAALLKALEEMGNNPVMFNFRDEELDSLRTRIKELEEEIKGIRAGEKAASDLKKLVNSSFGIAMNANDFFNYACADMVIVDPRDLEWILPIDAKYPKSGLDACLSFIAKQKPIKPWITDEFKEAYKELEKLNPEVKSEY